MAYRYLSYRMRTQKEIKSYLEEKAIKRNIQSSIIPEVIKQLQEEHLINDALFIEEFILSRSKSKPKGKFALTIELKQKGISEQLLDEYFQNNGLNEEKLAKDALIKKWKQYTPLPQDKRFKKSAGFLRSRGFTFEVIKKTIEEFESRE